MANFNPEHKAVLDDLLLGHALVRAGKMFGYPAYFAGEKLCICLYEQGVGVRLPEHYAAKLLHSDSNVIPFQPMGRPRIARMGADQREPLGRIQSLQVRVRRVDTARASATREILLRDSPPAQHMLSKSRRFRFRASLQELTWLPQPTFA